MINFKILFLCSDIYSWQDVYDVLIDSGIKNIPGKETYGNGGNKATTPRRSNAKSLRIFAGYHYHTLRESVKEMGDDLVGDGLLPVY